jgi:uncharacterized membrane-anchored protein YitT (DUF2179 family)
MTAKTIVDIARPYLVIAFGLLIFSIAWTAFLLPHQISGSGVSGIGAIVFYATGIPMGYTYFAINIIFLIVAMKVLGTGFGIKTIYGIALGAVMLSVLQPLIPDQVVGEKFMSALIGGGLCGVGVGLIFTQGGSAGGTDIIAMIVTKYRNTSPGRVILYCDVVIIGSSYFILNHLEAAQRIETMVYGFVTMAVQAYTIDAVLSGNRQSLQIFIFSRRYEQIADLISSKIKRGVTVIDSVGWYSRENQKVIVTLVRKQEASDLFRIVKEVDTNAFITVANVMGVYGKGFDEIKE